METWACIVWVLISHGDGVCVGWVLISNEDVCARWMLNEVMGVCCVGAHQQWRHAMKT